MEAQAQAPPKKKTKTKIVRYKFTPKSNEKAIARSAEKVMALQEQKEILSLAKRGFNPEEIAAKVGITAEEAITTTRILVNRFLGELALSATQHRQIDVGRCDALIITLDKLIQPQPMLDDRGRPVLDARTLEPAIMQPNPIYIKLYLDVMERRAKLLGLDKLEEVQATAIERRYVGANPDDI